MCRQAVDEGLRRRLRLRRRRHRDGGRHRDGRRRACRWRSCPPAPATCWRATSTCRSTTRRPACGSASPAATRAIDVGAIEDRKFVVMAGLGFDAAIMRDAPEGLKKAVGWPAYVVSAAKHLRGRGIRVTITIDDGDAAAPPGAHGRRRQRRQAAGQHPAAAGREAGRRDPRRRRHRDPQRPRLGPGHRPGDAPGRRARPPDGALHRQARARSRRATPQPRQLDGDVIEDSRTMDIRIEPGALPGAGRAGRRADVVGDAGCRRPARWTARDMSADDARTRCCGTTAGLHLVKDVVRPVPVRRRLQPLARARAAARAVADPAGHRLHRAVQHDQRRPGRRRCCARCCCGSRRAAPTRSSAQTLRAGPGAGRAPAASSRCGSASSSRCVALTTSMGQVERGANRIYGIQRDRPALHKYGRAVADGAARPACCRWSGSSSSSPAARSATCSRGRYDWQDTQLHVWQAGCASRSASCWRSARSRSSSSGRRAAGSPAGRGSHRRRRGADAVGRVHLRAVALRADTAGRSGRRTGRSPG